MTKADGKGGAGDSDGTLLQVFRIGAGVIFLGLFAWFVGYMVSIADDAEKTTWQRLSPIFTSLSTIAAGAAGAAFGNQVQKKRADRAERRADQKTRDAERGRALAASLKADARPAGGGGGPLERLGPGGGGGDDAVARHAALADELFPDDTS